LQQPQSLRSFGWRLFNEHFTARLKRLRKNDYSVRFASLRARLRQQGGVNFQQLTARLEVVP
jgi:hypothetical protein